MGEEAINMRLAHIDHMQQQAAAHLDHPLRAYSAQSRIQVVRAQTVAPWMVSAVLTDRVRSHEGARRLTALATTAGS